jgi:hypothetical protein
MLYLFLLFKWFSYLEKFPESFEVVKRNILAFVRKQISLGIFINPENQIAFDRCFPLEKKQFLNSFISGLINLDDNTFFEFIQKLISHFIENPDSRFLSSDIPGFKTQFGQNQNIILPTAYIVLVLKYTLSRPFDNAVPELLGILDEEQLRTLENVCKDENIPDEQLIAFKAFYIHRHFTK